MKLITCHGGRLLTLGEMSGDGQSCVPAAADVPSFRTGLAALDALAPGGAFRRGTVHEIIADPAGEKPLFLAALLARAALAGEVEEAGGGEWGVGSNTIPSKDPRVPVTVIPSERSDEGSRDRDNRLCSRDPSSLRSLGMTGTAPLLPTLHSPPPTSSLVWCDPGHGIYPPALAARGIDLDRLFLLQPRTPAEQTWAVGECLKCRGVAAVVAEVNAAHRLTRLDARRLQLSAERGGGVGLLLRPAGKGSAEHAAATRWLVRPAPGERTVQRWSVQLVHGHGGRVGHTVILEHSRETNRLRAVEQLAGRRRGTTAAKRTG